MPRSKDEWSYTSTPQYAFMAWCSVNTQGQLYLLPLHGKSGRFIETQTMQINSYVTKLGTIQNKWTDVSVAHILSISALKLYEIPKHSPQTFNLNSLRIYLTCSGLHVREKRL
jgi:hypothetical protein